MGAWTSRTLLYVAGGIAVLIALGAIGAFAGQQREEAEEARANATATPLPPVDSLRDCLGKLQPRTRLVWYFRVIHEMPSALIARHPKVTLNPGHIDVILQRARDAIRACMNEKGLDPGDMPTGTFVGLWEFLEQQQADIDLNVEVP